MTFNELLDIESQVADHNRTLRAEHAAAAPDDIDGRYIGGTYHEPWELPDAADLAEMERWGR